MAEENNSALTEAEQAYFESGGETEVVEAPQEQAQPDVALAEDKPEQGQEDQPVASQERDEKGKFVPHQALHAEREEHKKTKAELEQIKQRQAVLDDRWNTLLAAKEQQDQPKEETPPDPNEDVIGYFQYQAKKTQELNERLAAEASQREQQSQTEQQERLIWDTWQSSVAEARTATPDFDQAAQFLSQMRDNQLQAFAKVDQRFANPQARVAQINSELRQIIIAAKQNGQNPADAVYQIAQGYGYASGKAEQPNPQQETLDKVAMIDEAQRASKTLTASNGTNSGDPLSAEAIASMPPKEFEAWLKDPVNEKRFNALMGG